jgi:hypothetical protein
MIASSIVTHLVFVPGLLVGVGLLVWNRRITRSLLAGQRSSAEASEVRWLQRVQARQERSRGYQWYARFVTIAVGVFFIGISTLGIVIG